MQSYEKICPPLSCRRRPGSGVNCRPWVARSRFPASWRQWSVCPSGFTRTPPEIPDSPTSPLSGHIPRYFTNEGVGGFRSRTDTASVMSGEVFMLLLLASILNREDDGRMKGTVQHTNSVRQAKQSGRRWWRGCRPGGSCDARLLRKRITRW